MASDTLGGTPVTLHLYVDDVDAFVKRALDGVRPRNMYGQGGMVEVTGRYHPPACACAVHD